MRPALECALLYSVRSLLGLPQKSLIDYAQECVHEQEDYVYGSRLTYPRDILHGRGHCWEWIIHEASALFIQCALHRSLIVSSHVLVRAAFGIRDHLRPFMRGR